MLFNKAKTKLIAVPATIAGKYTIPDSVTSIENHAFTLCCSRTSLAIGNSVKTIENQAFEYCNHLKKVIIPDSVTTVGDRAFYGCDNLETITFGKCVTSIGKDAAQSGHYTKLKAYFLGDIPEFSSAWTIYYFDELYYLSGTTGWTTHEYTKDRVRVHEHVFGEAVVTEPSCTEYFLHLQ